ncbi:MULTISPECIES: hypothetical protein [Streptomyces]|uniref:Uncharacterized protein n=1 Tax=Streptomyces ehimensis TaxID=68195 RepID=A0ABV9BR53_9ACTN
MSKFGSLAQICVENPGALLGREDAQAESELDAADFAKANRALTDLGYVMLPEELLEHDYDGPSKLPSHAQRPSWWHRFCGTFG